MKIPKEVYPLIGMVSIACSFAIYTSMKHLMFDNDINLKKKQLVYIICYTKFIN